MRTGLIIAATAAVVAILPAGCSKPESKLPLLWQPGMTFTYSTTSRIPVTSVTLQVGSDSCFYKKTVKEGEVQEYYSFTLSKAELDKLLAGLRENQMDLIKTKEVHQPDYTGNFTSFVLKWADNEVKVSEGISVTVKETHHNRFMNILWLVYGITGKLQKTE